jgi:hypothetical protein
MEGSSEFDLDITNKPLPTKEKLQQEDRDSEFEINDVTPPVNKLKKRVEL